MSRRRLPFTQSAVTTAIKGAIKAGMTPTSAKIDLDGSITVTFGQEEAEPNEWDKVLGPG